MPLPSQARSLGSYSLVSSPPCICPVAASKNHTPRRLPVMPSEIPPWPGLGQHRADDVRAPLSRCIFCADGVARRDRFDGRVFGSKRVIPFR